MTRSRDTANIIPTVDAKGDLLVGTADNTIDNLSPGTNGQLLTANSATGTGLEWKTVSATEPVTYNSTTQTVGLSQSFINQTVQVFASAAARNTAIPTPTEGMTAYLEDTNTLETYNGAAWVNIANAGSTSYRFVSTVYFTSDGSFTKATYPWLRAIKSKAQGAGGGGGGGNGSATRGQSGGGGGGYAESFITNIAGLAGTVTVTIGSGGAGGGTGAVDTNGSSGGSSSFGSLTIGNGGAGGTRFAGGDGGSGTGDVVFSGTGGASGNGTNSSTSGSGGASHLGGGARGLSEFGGSSAGLAGRIYGGGGSGARVTGGSSAESGGAGANGIVIVELYA